MIVAMVAPLGRRSNPSTRACFEFARLVCWSTQAAFGRILDEACALAARPRLHLDMQKLLSLVPAQHRAATTQTPRRPGGAGGGSKPVRLAVRGHHTRSLCAESRAQSEQWCCWFGRNWIISGLAESRQILALSAIDQRSRKHPC
jgi:hypothetical protein